MELTRQIKNVIGVDLFKSRIEQKYGSPIIGHHQEQGIGVYELANGDEVKYWDEMKLIGNSFGRRGKDNKIPAHFTNTKYSEWGYKRKGSSEFVTNYPISFEAGTLAYARRIGLSEAQIKQAEKEGVGNELDTFARLDAWKSQVASNPSHKTTYSVSCRGDKKRKSSPSSSLGTTRR